jgi:hypothetical protein
MADDDDRIIQFPGSAGKKPSEPAKTAKGRGKEAHTEPTPADLANLSEDQRKAISLVMSGMPFVMIGIKPTTSGADFFTAVHGEAGDLRNASSHLPGVIERAFGRKGI